MQWVKYLMLSMLACLVVWSGWMIYTKQYAASAGMLFSALVIGGIYLFVWHPYVRQDALMARLEAKGVSAQALIVSVTGTSSFINQLPVMRINVRYTINGKEHAGEVKQPIPFQALASVRAGKRVSVLVNPDHETQFVLKL